MNKQQKLELFYKILRIRKIEEFLSKEYPNGNMRCPMHLSIGQEAIAVGVCYSLKKEDFVLSNHRAHAHYLAKGGSFAKMLLEIMGKRDGCCKGRGGSMHLVDLQQGFLGCTPIVAGTIPVAVGVALSISLKKEDNVVVVFLGEGATETGVFNESINFASLKNLPIIFVCENNFYSVYSPINVRQSQKRNRVKIALANGLFAKKEKNGNDVFKVYNLTKEAIKNVKENKTPAYIEFDTYRFKEHCGPFNDDNLNYRPQKEKEFWFKNCPLENIKNSLLKDNFLNEKLIQKIEEKISLEILNIFEMAKQNEFALFQETEERKLYF